MFQLTATACAVWHLSARFHYLGAVEYVLRKLDENGGIAKSDNWVYGTTAACDSTFRQFGSSSIYGGESGEALTPWSALSSSDAIPTPVDTHFGKRINLCSTETCYARLFDIALRKFFPPLRKDADGGGTF